MLASNFNENIDEAFINKNLESYKLTFNKFINNYTIKFM